MKAYLLNTSGDPKVLQMSNIPSPKISNPTDILIKVKTIGINYAEILSRKGQYSWAPPKPYVLGMESYGKVEKIGSSVTHVAVGDPVIVGGQYGCYAEKVIAPEHLVFKAIKEYTEEENAALLVNYMTAWVVLNKQARIAANEVLLVHAAAGGVGTAAIQLGKALGAHVIGTAGSNEKCEILKKMRVDRAINYLEQDFYQDISENYQGVDVVLEVVGGEVFKKSIELLNPFGRICIAGYASIPFKKSNPFTYWKTWRDAPKAKIMNMAKGSYGIFATHIGYLTENKMISETLFEEMKQFVLKNNIKPVIGKVYDFDEIPKAHEFMQSRKSHGKIVVKIG